MNRNATTGNTTQEKTARLIIDGKEINLPILSGSMGPDVIDIRSLYAQTGCFTYDPGFVSTASCQSDITFIDGDLGKLLYRGYPIDELAENAKYLEVAYLLLKGELPNRKQFEDYSQKITYHSMIHEQFGNFFNGFRRDAHPMSIMVGAMGALSSFYHDEIDFENVQAREIASDRLIAKVATVAAMAYKYSIGQPFVYPLNEYDYVSNFLHMCFSVPCEEYKISDTIKSAVEKILILHMDHEQNASTSTVRLASSSGANPFACIAAGISCLWGPAHGGANEAALNMLRQIGNVSEIPKYIEKAKDKNDPFRLMGFGHRVYKNYDPRATVMQSACHQVLSELGKKDDPILKVALELEKIALSDQYFIDRKLYPNIDFYSGITLSAIGFPTSMFTVLFALARTVGWVTQWSEMTNDPSQKIGRPRQLYCGYNQRKFVTINNR